MVLLAPCLLNAEDLFTAALDAAVEEEPAVVEAQERSPGIVL